MPGTLRIGVVAHMEDRIARIMERERVDKAEAKTIIAHRDRARAYYFKRFFGVDNSEDTHLYHMSINTSEVSSEYATEMVVAAAQAVAAGRFQAKVPAKA
jgi:cytidylate kinase